jgi:ABC-type Fe3+-hydroxamate transport system substrate-binding protein
MRTKIITAACILMVVALLLGGCAGEAETKTVTTTKTATTTATVATTATVTTTATATTTRTATQTVTATPTGDELITVLNPLGQPAPITREPMAPRLDTLDGKTIYVVDIMYPYTREFVQALRDVLAETYPDTTWVLKLKIGGYMDNDPELWSEISGKADGVVMAIGH